jgi:hypothetical protein
LKNSALAYLPDADMWLPFRSKKPGTPGFFALCAASLRSEGEGCITG